MKLPALVLKLVLEVTSLVLAVRFLNYSIHAKLKFPFRIHRTLVALSVTYIITEDTLEPCHLHLVLSTSPTRIVVILTATSAKAIRLVDDTR